MAFGLLLVLGAASTHAEETAPATQKPAPETSRHGSTGGPVEGLGVHGHWTIEVRDPDGTLVERREFENALLDTGKTLLTRILGRTRTVGPWSVVLGGGVPKICNGEGVFEGIPVSCAIGESGFNNGASDYCFENQNHRCSENLTVSVSVVGVPKVVLAGSVIAAFDGDIRTVSAGLNVCSRASGVDPADAPDDCRFGGPTPLIPPDDTPFLFPSTFTETNLATPIVVLAGQQVQVSVELTFF